MAHDRCNCYFSFWTIFCPFIPLTNGKIKISKKWKKLLEMSSFYTSLPKIVIIWYTVPEIWCMADVIVIFHFGLFFAFLPPLTAQKNQISKKWKKRDRQKKRYIEVGAPPKKHKSNFHYLAIFMMTSQILRSMHLKKTQKSRYLENETFLFLQIKKFINYT